MEDNRQYMRNRELRSIADLQRLLGHKSPETTLRYYAKIDENLVLGRWQKFLSEQKSRPPSGFVNGGK